MAIRYEMEFCLQRGIDGVFIFSDSTQAINYINATGGDLGPSDVIALEIHKL